MRERRQAQKKRAMPGVSRKGMVTGNDLSLLCPFRIFYEKTFIRQE